MRENPTVTNANIQIYAPLSSSHPIIVNAGPDDPLWFYPHVQRQIHRTPFCGGATDSPSQIQ